MHYSAINNTQTLFLYFLFVSAPRETLERDKNRATVNMLAQMYEERFSNHIPIPWHPDKSMDLLDFYQGQFIIDAKGYKSYCKSIIL